MIKINLDVVNATQKTIIERLLDLGFVEINAFPARDLDKLYITVYLRQNRHVLFSAYLQMNDEVVHFIRSIGNHEEAYKLFNMFNSKSERPNKQINNQIQFLETIEATLV